MVAVAPVLSPRARATVVRDPTFGALGPFERKVFLAVFRLGEAAFAAEIARHLSIDKAVSQPQVVAALFRIKEIGLLVSETVLPDTPRQGFRRRNVYRLTAAGKAALAEAGVLDRHASVEPDATTRLP